MDCHQADCEMRLPIPQFSKAMRSLVEINQFCPVS